MFGGIKRLDINYFKLLKEGIQLDRLKYRKTKNEIKEIYRLWGPLITCDQESIELDGDRAKSFQRMIEYARESMIRFKPELGLSTIQEYTNNLKESMEKGTVAIHDVRAVFDDAGNYLKKQLQQFKFPGDYMVRSFVMLVKALHYEKVAKAITSRSS